LAKKPFTSPKKKKKITKKKEGEDIKCWSKIDERTTIQVDGLKRKINE
jgi:hypothetical protein